MAKAFLDDERSAVTTSGAPIPISTASTSILSTSKNGEENKSEIAEPPQEEKTAPVPSAPPITEQPSYNTPSITHNERSKILAALRKAKSAILHSRSKAGEAKGLSEALEEILSITETASGRMSERQANEIIKEISQIMIYRNKMQESKKLMQKITDGENSRDCLDIFSGLIMVSRSISDIVCIILAIMSHHLYITPLLLLLILAAGSCMFTYFILIGYCYNVCRKINTKSRLGKIETVYCILFAILYGVLSTIMVFILPVPELGPAICGYVSMITCILQRCLKCDSNPWKKNNRRRSSYNNIMLAEVGNNITIGNNTENTIDHTESRIAAVENLKIRIENCLTQVLQQGKGKINLKEITVSENQSRANIVHNIVTNYDTPIHRTNDSFFDTWMFWSLMNSNSTPAPLHFIPGEGVGCYNCCCVCCFCEDDGGCCDNAGCCESAGDDSGCCGDCGDCDFY